MKQNNISKSGSGGRTWAAMLKTYSYIYEDADGCLKPTKVAQAILDGNKVPENVKKQVLTLQIPNGYFLSKDFKTKYADGYSIQPINFLIRLANDDRIQKRISKEEIILFAMTAQKDDELDEKVDEINKYRQADDETKAEIANKILNANGDISRVDSKKDFSKYDSVATTFTILCRFTEYVEPDHNTSGLKGIDNPKLWKEFLAFSQRYPFDKTVFIDPAFYTLRAGLDVDTYKASYGVNAHQASNSRKRDIKAKQLLNKYPNPENLSVDELINILSNGFSSANAKKVAEDIKAKKFEVTSDAFLELYTHEEDNLEFERETARVLKNMGLDVELHPSPTSSFNNANENIDVMATALGKYLILVDAKNYSKNFNLSASLRNVMANSYLAGYKGYKGLNPSYYCYVTAKHSSNDTNLIKINELAKKNSDLDVHGMMITASALYYFVDYCLKNDISPDNRVSMFLKLFTDKSYNSFVEVAVELNIDL